MSPNRQSKGGSGNVAASDRVLALVRPDQTIVWVNHAYCRMVGKPFGEIVGGSVAASGIADEERSSWVYDRLPPPGLGFRYAREMPVPGGTLRHDIEIHRLDMAGEDLVLVELTPAEGLVESDANVLGMVLDRAPGLGVVVFDRDLRILRVNAMVERIGRITQGHVGMILTEAVPDVNPTVVRAIRRVFAAGEAFVNLEVSSGDRSDRAYLVTVFPIGGRAAQVEWVGMIFSDVSDRVTAERALADSEQHRRDILGSLLHAEEDERSRIATELHDDTVQVMTAALLSMDRLAMISRTGDVQRVASAVAHTRAVLEEATERTRRLMFELRPAILHESGLGAALELLAQQTARETGATTHVSVDARRYDPVVEELVYRTVQEALANARKHARPRVITVRLAEEDGGTGLAGEVSDDGRGFDPVLTQRRSDAPLHLGIESMVERIRAAGGDVDVTSAPGRGTRIAFSVPLSLGRDAESQAVSRSQGSGRASP
jgi:signal transduction histidine kinase